MLAPVVVVSPLVKLRRLRMLPVPGRVLARVGEQVGPEDVVAEAQARPRHLLLDVAEMLELPRNKAEEVIRCKPGQIVSEDEVLAGPVGLFRQTVRAPQHARVVVVGDGKILLQLETPPLELRAAFPGEVVEVREGWGVVIENTGALIQGVWGNERPAQMGLLQVLASGPDQPLTLEHLDISLRGQIAFAAHCGEAAVLDMAEEIGVQGLILGSMSAALLSRARRVRFPLVVLEGFGPLPVDEKAFQLLSSLQNREVVVYAAAGGLDREQPEVFAPAMAGREVELPALVEYWRPGVTVRLFGGPHMGRTGELVRLLPGLTPMPSGVRVPAALVRLADQEQVAVPLSNLQILT